MHFLTLDEIQQSTKMSVQRILFVYTSSVYFRNFIYWVPKCATVYVNYSLNLMLVVPGSTTSRKMNINTYK